METKSAVNRVSGFTLIELMVVMTIIAIIAAIAYPAYTEYVREAQRVDATAALLRLQTEQEKFYLDNNTYADDLADLPGISGTEQGWYTLSITNGDANGFTAQAVPASDSPQRYDEECQVFTINAQGVQGAENGGGADTTAECWR